MHRHYLTMLLLSWVFNLLRFRGSPTMISSPETVDFNADVALEGYLEQEGPMQPRE